MKIGVLADDLTGAADAALAFERAGFPAEIAMWGARRPAGRPRVWVLDTGSRGLSGPSARRRVREGVRFLKGWKAGFIFKKIDSTLRGPVGPELDGFLEDLGPFPGGLPVVPAFPALGRVTVEGEHLVDGFPLHRTAFGKDPRRPLSTSRVAEIVGAGRGGRKGIAGLWVPDVADEASLLRVAREARERGVPAAAGSAGFAEALAGLFPRDPGMRWKRKNFGRAAAFKRRPLVLLVTGSANPVSRTQAARFALGGANVFQLAAPEGRGDPVRVLRSLARRAEAARRKLDIRRFAVTGGETAAAVARAAGAARWRILAEVDRGVPLLVTVGARRKSWWVMKPGGFGGEDLWTRAIKLLSRT